MAKIEGFRVRNFKVLKDVTLGRLWNRQQTQPLTPMTVVIGKNGVGKSAYLMLSDSSLMPSSPVSRKPAMHEGAEASRKYGRKGKKDPLSLRCTTGKTGMLDLLHTRLPLRQTYLDAPTSCENASDRDERVREAGQPFSFLFLNNGKGVAWKGEQEGRQIDEEEIDRAI